MENGFEKLLDKWSMRDAGFEIRLFCYMSLCVHFLLFLFTFWQNTYFALYQILSVFMYIIIGIKFTGKKFILTYAVILCEIVVHSTVVWLFTGDTCYSEQYIVFLIIIMSYIVFFVGSFKKRMIFSVTSMTVCMLLYFGLRHVLSPITPPINIREMQNLRNLLSIFFSISTLIFLSVWVFIQTVRNHTQVQKLKQDNSRLKISNDVDFLTGVYSRKYAQVVLDERYRIYCETGKIFSVAIGDIDFFKSVNDEYGHEAGDLVLEKIGTLFAESIREADIPSRWGGEEFLFIFEADLETAAVALERLRRNVEKTSIPVREREISVTMTFGCTQIRQGETVLELVHRADSYLYWGKKAGRNRVVTSKCFEEADVNQGL